jgi:hypothetical protein
MGKAPTVYNDAKCVRKPNGKWRCDLFTSPMFEEIPDVKPLTLQTPEGMFEIPASQMEATVRSIPEKERRKEVVDNLDEVVSYKCHAVTVESNRLQIIASKNTLMTKLGESHTEMGAARNRVGRSLTLHCEFPKIKPLR